MTVSTLHSQMFLIFFIFDKERAIYGKIELKTLQSGKSTALFYLIFQ
jgi:hypothetical protein